jgi:hypothetical protein
MLGAHPHSWVYKPPQTARKHSPTHNHTHQHNSGQPTKHNQLQPINMFSTLFTVLPLIALVSASPLTKRYHGVVIQSARDGECISPDVGSAFYVEDGTPVVSKACDQALRWDISPGSGSVMLHGNNKFALDAGSQPGNNGALKVWTSYPGLYQQK